MTKRAAQRQVSADPAGEFPFGLTDYVPHLIAAISQFRDTALDAELRKLGLNVGRYRVMGVLVRFGECAMSELANFTAIDRTTLTRIADNLVEAGLVERRANARDRRQVKLALTQSGAKLHRAALKEVFSLNEQLLAGVREEEARVAARVLQAIVGALAPNAPARESIIHYSRDAVERLAARPS